MAESKHESDYFGLLLILALILLAALYLRTTEWTANLDLVFIAVFCGFSLGFLLGKSRFDLSSVFWVGYSFTLIFVFLLSVIMSNHGIHLVNTLFSLIYRTGNSLYEFSAGREVTSPEIILMAFTLIFWVISVAGSFSYTRNQIYNPVLIIVFLIFILIEFFLVEKERNLWITGLAALLALLVYLYKTTPILLRGKKGYGPSENEKKPSLLKPTVLTAVLVIVVVAWSVPSVIRAATPGTPEAQRFDKFSYQFRNNFSRLTASLRGSSRAAVVGFGPSLPLGLKAAEAEKIVFTATSSAKLPAAERIYWRSKVYEIYSDGVWREGEQRQVTLKPGEVIFEPATTENQIPYTFRVKAGTPLGDYFIPGELVSLNNPANLIYSPLDDGGKDIIAVEPESTMLTGNGYRVDTIIKPESSTILTAATGESPDWVRNRYLEIPSAIQPGIRTLAEQITAGSKTDYEKAQAITGYLRTRYRYLTEVEAPAIEQDRIEWFLYDGKAGFCNYFATAEVLLLRSIGIPARLAVGFSEGEVSADGFNYTVRERNRHSWPEVFFPTIGWVIFEPTPSLPVIQFPKEELEPDTELEGFIPDEALNLKIRPAASLPSEEALLEGGQSPGIVYESSSLKYELFPGIMLILTIVVTIPAIVFAYSSRQEKTKRILQLKSFLTSVGMGDLILLDHFIRRWQIPMIESVYNDIVRFGTFLFGIDPSNRTPAEVIQGLIEVCPGIAEDAQKMLQEYQRCVFGDRLSNDEMARKLGWRIQSKMIKLKIAGIFHPLRRG